MGDMEITLEELENCCAFCFRKLQPTSKKKVINNKIVADFIDLMQCEVNN
jgi:hypothetical protein